MRRFAHLQGHAASARVHLARWHTTTTTTPGKVVVHVTTRDGTRVDVAAPVGISLMQALRDVAKVDVPGTCDGEMECCTCHVYLSPVSFERAGEPSEEELDLLDKAVEVRETSRLSCQVDLTADMDGLEVELAHDEGNDS